MASLFQSTMDYHGFHGISLYFTRFTMIYHGLLFQNMVHFHKGIGNTSDSRQHIPNTSTLGVSCDCTVWPSLVSQIAIGNNFKGPT